MLSMFSPDKLKPLGFLPSLLYFFLPAILMVICFYGLMPVLKKAGLSELYAYLISMSLPLLLLGIAALIAFRVEGHPMTWEALKVRFRLKPMTGKDCLWLAICFGIGVGGHALVSKFSTWLITTNMIPLPNNLPSFLDVRGSVADISLWEQAAGGSLRGNWTMLFAMLITLVINILGEELWWRGIILPRNELAFGSWVVVIHGLLWAFFHIFKWWDVANLIPISLALTFLAVRRENTTPTIVMHFLTNGSGMIPLFLYIIGITNKF
jgi:membrane protease YdiL (CAAX protease family)